MKTKAILIIGTAVVAMYSCDTKNYTEQDRIQSTSNLENFVDSVESAVKIVPVHNWSLIDERYDSLESRAEKVYDDLKVEDNNLEMIENRYDTVIKNAKAEADNFERTADMHMKNVETWWETTSSDAKAGTKSSVDAMEVATKESLDWLTNNFDKLNDNSRKKYEELTMKFQRD